MGVIDPRLKQEIQRNSIRLLLMHFMYSETFRESAHVTNLLLTTQPSV